MNKKTKLSFTALPLILALLASSLPAAAQNDLEVAMNAAGSIVGGGVTGGLTGIYAVPRVVGVVLADGANPKAAPAKDEEGPAAALAFEKKYRGEKNPKGGVGMSQEELYPDAKPVPFSDTKNIVQMNDSLWSRDQIVADFKKNHKEGEVAAIVLVKTEFCCTNFYRPCAVTTAVFEKRAASDLKKFRVYGAWVRNPKALPKDATVAQKKAKTAWDEKVMDEYDFEQGPGATIVFINPKDGKAIKTDASQMQLFMEPFDKEGGKVPVLEKALAKVLEIFAK
ncbi:MAG: hypothetical protein HY077_06500 [Elusimicrobia bacterium]|nr:hypothetical protein [Elusimicrobiota bacterium]